jgi:lipopolysaccharide/colanic/teichoic acid biosynthesis glycosyltransferase
MAFNRVIIGGDETLLSAAVLDAVRETCAQRDIVIDFVPSLIGLAPLPKARRAAALRLAQAPPRPEYQPPAYFWHKRLIDFLVALVAIVIFSPLLLVVSVLVLFDFGAPAVFWQKRIGRNGKSFLLYKFRTLHAPFDRDGQPNGNGDYESWIGKFLRRLRLDELPQLFHVLVGEMSLIGPRPLLPQDQPTNSTLRLMVRPGITGWAQINGGNLVTTEEKGALDDWYVRNASFWLDLRIAVYTLVFLFTGERRAEHAVQEATLLRQTNGHPKTEEGKRAEIREITAAAHHQSTAKLPINARARAHPRRRANWPEC